VHHAYGIAIHQFLANDRDPTGKRQFTIYLSPCTMLNHMFSDVSTPFSDKRPSWFLLKYQWDCFSRV